MKESGRGWNDGHQMGRGEGSKEIQISNLKREGHGAGELQRGLKGLQIQCSLQQFPAACSSYLKSKQGKHHDRAQAIHKQLVPLRHLSQEKLKDPAIDSSGNLWGSVMDLSTTSHGTSKFLLVRLSGLLGRCSSLLGFRSFFCSSKVTWHHAGREGPFSRGKLARDGFFFQLHNLLGCLAPRITHSICFDSKTPSRLMNPAV